MAPKTGKSRKTRKTRKTTTIFVHLFTVFLALCFFGMMVRIIAQPKPGRFVIYNLDVLSSLCVFFGAAVLLYFIKYYVNGRQAVINAVYAASTRVTGYPRPETIFLEQLRNELEKKREKRKQRKKETAIRRSRKSTA